MRLLALLHFSWSDEKTDPQKEEGEESTSSYNMLLISSFAILYILFSKYAVLQKPKKYI